MAKYEAGVQTEETRGTAMEPAKFTPPKAQIVRPEAGLLSVTDRAAQEIKAALSAETEPYQGLRVGLEAGGCSGYQYALSFSKDIEPNDVVVESNGIKVMVKKEDAELLKGATVDFVETPMGSGFHVKNPNARHSCGCGNSFDA